MNKYCCFFCSSNTDNTNRRVKTLNDQCASCGRSYGFVLDHPPAKISDYTIYRRLGRGFYGATYIATRGAVDKKYVIKISPVEFYKHKPPFKIEVDRHVMLAKSSTHVVGIIDAFDTVVNFSDVKKTSLNCYVTIMDYVDGYLFKDFSTGESMPSVASICQVAIDLLQLQADLAAKMLRHNDLHSENLIIETLRPEFRRQGAIDPSLRVMAIDLGSVSDNSRSTDIKLGDLAFIAEHVDALLSRLLARPEELADRDFRIALALQGVIHSLGIAAQNNRLPNPDDLIEQIKESFYRASHHWRPWRTPLNLRSFSDHYNAQTLESWDVPKLRVDHEDKWLIEVTGPGPQIITGMRGCGKTILLRALDIHARLASGSDEPPEVILQRIKTDKYVGLFVSAQRLLDLREQGLLFKIEHRLARLFVAYALQSVRALMHLSDIDQSSITPDAHSRLALAVSDILTGTEELKRCVSLDDLENKLQRVFVLIIKDREKYLAGQSPSEVFTHLASTLRECSDAFNNSTIFFLLDDVSTRYLELDKIEGLLSVLLFQSPICAFKFTSEWQTIELGLKSPGRIHPARIGRDLTIFDLGADVFNEINAKGANGKRFVSDILLNRAKTHAQHPSERNPNIILGDVSLESVARKIGAAKINSEKRQSIYWGLSCLTKFCVGDVGDVIKLYEEIIKRGGSDKAYPISSKIQSECFQEICSVRLYDLNRRADYFKNHALAFAQASHELLVRSSRNSRGRAGLRQFYSIYVKITVEDDKVVRQQIDGLRDLIDAGVFVFSGGAAPRSKTIESNSIQQFKLSFRKVYGLGTFIGLANRDRFELSGDELSKWLDHPEMAKEILIRNQISSEMNEVIDESDESIDVPEELPPRQAGLSFASVETDIFPELSPTLPKKAPIVIKEMSENDLMNLQIDTVLTGLGFEDRTLASNQFLSDKIRPSMVHAIRYEMDGYAEEILNAWKQTGATIFEFPDREAVIKLPHLEGNSIVDISGLSKPIIFKAIRGELLAKSRVLVCHALASQYYPLNEELEKLFAAEKVKDNTALLSSLAEILIGEEGPYTSMALLDDMSDSSRSRALLAFSSAKHERLFSLLDKREFDQIEVIAPQKNSPRSKVANYAAEIACQNFTNANVTRIDTNDLERLVDYLDTRYLEIYGTGGANFELALTGSKIQAVAAAILSSTRKVSQAWYLSPRKFDVKRFSSGVGEIKVFEIKIGRDS